MNKITMMMTMMIMTILMIMMMTMMLMMTTISYLKQHVVPQFCDNESHLPRLEVEQRGLVADLKKDKSSEYNSNEIKMQQK